MTTIARCLLLHSTLLVAACGGAPQQAETLRVERRGRLVEGYFADVVAFDPERIQDHATFTEPHQYATGMVHVLVNGVPVLADGEHTGATPGRVVRGPGWTG